MVGRDLAVRTSTMESDGPSGAAASSPLRYSIDGGKDTGEATERGMGHLGVML